MQRSNRAHGTAPASLANDGSLAVPNNPKVGIAADWYTAHGHTRRRGVIPTLRNRFGLSNSEAIEALTIARTILRQSSEDIDNG